MAQGPSLGDLFTRIDANGDGLIDPSENAVSIESRHPRSRHESRPRRAANAHDPFARPDADNDGRMSHDELQQAMQRALQPTTYTRTGDVLVDRDRVPGFKGIA